MCSACGFPAAPGHWTEAGANTAPDRLRARFRRAQVLQKVLPAYGLTARGLFVELATKQPIAEAVARELLAHDRETEAVA